MRRSRTGSRGPRAWPASAAAGSATHPRSPHPGALRARVPVLRLSAAVLLLLLTLALIGTAALIGGRLLERPTDPEKLLYGLDGDIFLADADGGNPTKVAEGAGLSRGSPWAPDGRHFLSYDTTRMTAVIRDADGVEVASLPDGFAPDWSPDSTRLQAWARGRTADRHLWDRWRPAGRAAIARRLYEAVRDPGSLGAGRSLGLGSIAPRSGSLHLVQHGSCHGPGSSTLCRPRSLGATDRRVGPAAGRGRPRLWSGSCPASPAMGLAWPSRVGMGIWPTA